MYALGAGAAKRSLFIALRHAQIAVDVVIEEDLVRVADRGRGRPPMRLWVFQNSF